MFRAEGAEDAEGIFSQMTLRFRAKVAEGAKQIFRAEGAEDAEGMFYAEGANFEFSILNFEFSTFKEVFSRRCFAQRAQRAQREKRDEKLTT
jgi:hypothetical protein